MIPGIRLVILGKQGAGKGTQCVFLSHHYVVPHISTGEMLRRAAKTGTELGLQAKDFMDRGELIPDDLMIGLVAERLNELDVRTRGFLLDGFPRTVQQAEALDSILTDYPLDATLDLAVPTEIVVKRLAGRLVCRDCGTTYHEEDSPPARAWACDNCGGPIMRRADDNEDAIRRRLALYEEQTAPLIDWYGTRGQLVTIDGLGQPETVFERAVAALEAHRGSESPNA